MQWVTTIVIDSLLALGYGEALFSTAVFAGVLKGSSAGKAALWGESRPVCGGLIEVGCEVYHTGYAGRTNDANQSMYVKNQAYLSAYGE